MRASYWRCIDIVVKKPRRPISLQKHRDAATLGILPITQVPLHLARLLYKLPPPRRYGVLARTCVGMQACHLHDYIRSPLFTSPGPCVGSPGIAIRPEARKGYTAKMSTGMHPAQCAGGPKMIIEEAQWCRCQQQSVAVRASGAFASLHVQLSPSVGSKAK